MTAASLAVPPLAEVTAPTIDLETAAAYLGVGRTTAYALARVDAFPCRVVRVGKQYRVVVSSLREVLGVSA